MKSRKIIFQYLAAFIFSFLVISPIPGDSGAIGNPSNNKIDWRDNIFLKSNKKLIYNSTFGKTTSSIKKKDSLYILIIEGEDFYYRQSYLIKNDGIYIYETYQKMSPMFFVEIEDRFTYSNPVLRLPLPFSVNKKWEWSGREYNDDDENQLTVKGKIIGKELLKTKAGTFDTYIVETIIESTSGTKNILKEWISQDTGSIKSEIKIIGGGVMGMLRDLLGYGEIFFEVEEIK